MRARTPRNLIKNKMMSSCFCTVEKKIDLNVSS